MINYIKIPFLAKVGFAISALGYAFQQGGLKQVCIYIKYSITNAIFRYRFKHSTKFRNKIISGLNASNIGFIALIGLIHGDEEFRLRNCIKYLSDEEKEKYKKQTLESVQTTIKNTKPTNEEQLEGVLDMFGLDLLGVKVEDIVPKKTSKKKVNKTKVYSIPTAKVK